MIGLYIAFMLPIILRLRAGEKFERGAWQPRQPLQVDRLARDPVDRVHLHRVHAAVQLQRHAVEHGFDWNLFNYTPIAVGAAFLLFGGWYVISAKNWFKGPIRQGDEAELERIEREFGEGDEPAPAPAAP